MFATDGTLYAAGGETSNLFEVNPDTGESTDIGNTGFYSGGDLAFNQEDLFLSSRIAQLVRIDLANDSKGTAVGPFGFTRVWGMSTGADGLLYGLSDTSLFAVDISTGDGTFISDYGGQGLGGAYGSDFAMEGAVPIPASAWLFSSGLVGLIGFRRKYRKI